VAESEKFDLVIIGCGGGREGRRAGRVFPQAVAVIERAGVPGGSCINTGTVRANVTRIGSVFPAGAARALWDRLFAEGKFGHSRLHAPREEVVEMERRRILKNLELHRLSTCRGKRLLRMRTRLSLPITAVRGGFVAK